MLPARGATGRREPHLPGRARDQTIPQDDRALTLPGEMFFGWESPTWGGGIAFYDAEAAGTTLARDYLVTEQQFADVAAQEMHRQPGEDLDLSHVLEHARHEVGTGRYEALHLVGELEGAPVLTFTTPDPTALQRSSPTRAYLRMIVAGLRQAHGLSDDALTAYLVARPGIQPAWDTQRIGDLVSEPRRP